MLDSDLAKLYNVETKRINEAVKNNQRQEDINVQIKRRIKYRKYDI